MEDALVHSDTGELFSTSDAAIAAAHRRRDAEEAETLGSNKAHLLSALMAASEKLPAGITTDKKGNRSKYASLKQILETVGPTLHAEGIRIRQGVDRSYPLDDGHGSKGRLVIVYTDLIHAETAEVERTIVEIPLVQMDAQAMGSAITYGRRYSLLAALGLATDEADDDGENAAKKSLADKQQKTVELQALLKEIAGFKDPTSLVEWGQKQTGRLNKLSEAERALAHEAYNNKAQALLDAPDDTGTTKKGAKS